MTKMNRTAGWTAGAIALLLCAPSAFSGDFEALAVKLSGAAKARNRARVAILPFQVIGGRGSTSGRIVSERLVAPIMAAGQVQVVERAMLESVMREQQLQFSGVVDARSVKEIGKILDVDAVITGTVIALRNDRVEINARLIDTESAMVLFAGETRTEQDWNESMFDDAAWNGVGASWPPLPSFDLATNASAAEWGCIGAGDRVDELERSVVDLKARYWAQKLREGLDGATLTRNPGSEIQNQEIRSQFHKSLRAHAAVDEPALTAEELGKLKDALQRISRINDSCRGEGS